MVDKTTAELDAVSVQAGIALEQYQTAVRDQYEAQMAELLLQQQLDDSEVARRESGADLGRWARLSYQRGGAVGELSVLLALMQSSSPADLSRNLVTLREVAGDKTVVLVHAAAAQRALALRSAGVQATSVAAVTAVRAADVARQRSQDLVDAQQATLLTLTSLLQDARTAAQAAARRSAALATEPMFGCGGADITQYPNGMVAPEALCPLRGAAGQQLRADAAQAFDALSLAWAADFGAPVCVSDSYRSLGEQVSLYAAKPALAARPGTSNHGWGVAVDLCGGVQTFGTEQHQWMVRNGPAFGWFHPQWARQGGGKPEAWHWEFAG